MEMEAQTLKRSRPREPTVPTRKKGAEISPERLQWMARVQAETVARVEKEMAEAKNKPPADRYALQAAEFRVFWERIWSKDFGGFEDTTKIPSMCFTDNPAPFLVAHICDSLQVFSVRVVGLKGGLQWPLHVFGTVALRDAVDRKRNVIFHRKRDNCQIITEEDPNLKLTGPTRAVVMLCPVTFEVELAVKGTTESEDKDLSYLAVELIRPTTGGSSLFTRDYTSKLSTLEFTYGHIFFSLEATISVRVVSGSWHGYRCQFSACTESFNEEVLLLDSGDEEVAVADDGKIKLSREVASVERSGRLKVFVKASHGDDFLLMIEKVFAPKEAGRSHRILDTGFCKMKITVAWSLITVDYNPKEK